MKYVTKSSNYFSSSTLQPWHFIFPSRCSSFHPQWLSLTFLLEFHPQLYSIWKHFPLYTSCHYFMLASPFIQFGSTTHLFVYSPCILIYFNYTTLSQSSHSPHLAFYLHYFLSFTILAYYLYSNMYPWSTFLLRCYFSYFYFHMQPTTFHHYLFIFHSLAHP